jgi:hypothetical protein
VQELLKFKMSYGLPQVLAATPRATRGIWNPVPLYRIGQNRTYWYVPVRNDTTQYKSVREFHGCTYWYVPVHTSQYILVCSFNKASCFLTHPERVRRDKIKVEKLLCMGYNVTRSNFKTAQVC